LGLLYITSGRVAEAEAAWRPLDKLGKDSFLHLFKTGMLHLVRDEFKESASCLERGIKANNFNEPLNNDMRKVLRDVQERLGKALAEHAQRLGPPGKGATARADSASAARQDRAASLQKRVAERLKAVDAADPQRDRKQRRVFIESVLSLEFGDALQADPK